MSTFIQSTLSRATSEALDRLMKHITFARVALEGDDDLAAVDRIALLADAAGEEVERLRNRMVQLGRE